MQPSRLFSHPAAEPETGYRTVYDGPMSEHDADRARSEIITWPGYEVTPLRSLPDLANQLGIADLLYKDEAGRFGLGSFKALGGAYAILRDLQRTLGDVSSADLRTDRFHERTRQITMTCATDGNHGRSVAWGARLFGCRSTIFLPAATSPGREQAIAGYGADVQRVNGSYDDAVRHADEQAGTHGWRVISDTSYAGYVEVPVDVMHGYTVMVSEAVEQWEERAPTHVFVQAGVGGLAAAVATYLWARLGRSRPHFTVVEPLAAACCLATAEAGAPTTVHGVHDTVMACLAAGDVSLIAWDVLSQAANAFLAIDDQWSLDAMRALAATTDGPVIAGESGAAGLAGLMAVASDTHLRSSLGLDEHSRVLLFGTEGATDPTIYEEIVGRRPA